MRPRPARIVSAVVLALPLVVTPASARRPRPCAGGRFLVSGESLIAGDATLDHEAITVQSTHVALGAGCPSVRAKVTAVKGGETRVKATWPVCQGLTGHVTLHALLPANCATMTGTLTARKAHVKKPFSADLSRCGDGIVDAGASEECDPPQTGSCDTRCRVPVATTTIGAAGGHVTSADGLFTLDVPSGALASDVAITVRRRTLGEIPQDLVDAGADVAYDLGPDGLQFASPATATFHMGPALAPDGSVSGPVAALFTTNASSTTGDVLAAQQTVLDAGTDTAEVTGALGHFSTVVRFWPRSPTPGTRSRLTVTIDPSSTLPIERLIGVMVKLETEKPKSQTILVTYEDRTLGPVVQYAGAPQVTIGSLDPLNGTVKKSIPGYSCGSQAGQGDLKGSVSADIPKPAALTFLLGPSVVLTIDFSVPITCVDETTPTTSTTATTTTVTTTTDSSTTSRTATTASTSSSMSTSTSSTTSTTSTTGTTSTTTTSTTTVPPAGCCDCPDGSCFSGSGVGPATCDFCSGGQGGTFVPNADCPLTPGRCQPRTTTTSIPSCVIGGARASAFTCPGYVPGTCYGAQASLECQAKDLVEPAAGVTTRDLLWTGIATPGQCATHSQVGYLIDATTGKSLSIYLFQRTGGDTEYSEHVLYDGSKPATPPWSVRIDVTDTGPAGYAGGLTKSVYPVVCFY